MTIDYPNPPDKFQDRHFKMTTIHFLSLTDAGYSRSWTYYKGLSKTNVNANYVRVKKPYIKSLLQLRGKILPKDEVVITSPSHLLVLFARITLKRRVILDAGWSLYEGEVVSRRTYGLFGSRAVRIYLIDFFANHFAKMIFVETNLQKRYYQNLFILPRGKVKVLYTGLDEFSFKADVQPSSFRDPKNDYFSVLFRGKYNLEAGLEVLSKAAELLYSERILFSIYAPGMPKSISFTDNVQVYREHLTKPEIAFLLKNTDLALGQLSNNPRLSRTIPHKAFEAAFCSAPYLTARSSGVLEVFSEEEVLTFEPGNPKDLAGKILSISKSPTLNRAFAEAIKRKYESTLSQDILTQRFLECIGKGVR
jgi:glycosyltransferase involved in cell wall biosynthesis